MEYTIVFFYGRALALFGLLALAACNEERVWTLWVAEGPTDMELDLAGRAGQMTEAECLAAQRAVRAAGGWAWCETTTGADFP